MPKITIDTKITSFKQILSFFAILSVIKYSKFKYEFQNTVTLNFITLLMRWVAFVKAFYI